MMLFILGYVIAPFALVWHAFFNERDDFKRHMDDTDKLFNEIPTSVGSMYREIFRWGFLN